MKKIIWFFSFLLLFIGCSDRDYDYTGGNMEYDKFRGSSSSLANQVQFECFKKCIEHFDFSKYSGKKVVLEVYAGNSQIERQLTSLLNIIFIKNRISSFENEYVAKGNHKPVKYDYKLKFNAICGGYHFYPGIVFYKYQSTARIIMLESMYKEDNNSKYFDSGYKNATLFKWVFTQEFRVSVYIIFFLICIFILARFGVFEMIKKNKIS